MTITLTNPHTLKATQYSAELLETADSVAEYLDLQAQYAITGPRGASRLLQLFNDGSARAIDLKGRSIDYTADLVAA